jgi:hypothetical protein
MSSLFRGALAACAFLFAASSASAATYSLHVDVGATSIDGFFAVNGASSNYVGGGTTTKADLLDYSLTFKNGANTFVGTPANLLGLQTFNITYSLDLLTVTAWDISIAFTNPATPGIAFQFGGNNNSFAQVTNGGGSPFNDSAFPGPTLTAELQPTPLPGALLLFATGLGAMGFFGWRRKRKNAAAVAAP